MTISDVRRACPLLLYLYARDFWVYLPTLSVFPEAPPTGRSVEAARVLFPAIGASVVDAPPLCLTTCVKFATFCDLSDLRADLQIRLATHR